MTNKKKTLRQRYIDDEEYKKFLNIIEDEVDYILFLLCGNLGLRTGELVRLRLSDLVKDNKGYYLRIPTLKRNKKKGVINESMRNLRGVLPSSYEEAPIPKNLLEIVLNYIKKFKIKNWLFPYGRFYIPEYSVARKFKRYAREAGLDPRYSVHSLRHFKGFQVYKEKQDLRAVQLILRHRSVMSSAIYADANIESKRKLIEGIETVT